MAAFGVPDVGKQDATNAVTCAVNMMREIERWNKKRLSAGRDAINVGITAHYGLAVLGDIGTRQSMSFTIIGDTVNTTTRIQELCRSLKINVLLTCELFQQLSLETTNHQPMPMKFVDAGSHILRGRSKPIRVFTLENEAA